MNKTSASNAKFPKQHSKKDCVCGGHSAKAHREKGRSRYNPEMVRKIKRAQKGKFIEIPNGDIVKWLEKL